MNSTMEAMPASDRIEKEIVLDAPRSRVWRALTDAREFSAWFGVTLTTSFAPGTMVTGKMRSKNYEHVTLELRVETMEPEHRFAFRWHPYAIEPGVDYSSEPTTLVTFTLADAGDGTRLTVVESGFDAIPASRRAKAFTSNTKGWAAQLENIRRHVTAAAAG
jgi:uncharacterized protein YndB with AHSA1/START domain